MAEEESQKLLHALSKLSDASASFAEGDPYVEPSYVHHILQAALQRIPTTWVHTHRYLPCRTNPSWICLRMVCMICACFSRRLTFGLALYEYYNVTFIEISQGHVGGSKNGSSCLFDSTSWSAWSCCQHQSWAILKGWYEQGNSFLSLRTQGHLQTLRISADLWPDSSFNLQHRLCTMLFCIAITQRLRLLIFSKKIQPKRMYLPSLNASLSTAAPWNVSRTDLLGRIRSRTGTLQSIQLWTLNCFTSAVHRSNHVRSRRFHNASLHIWHHQSEAAYTTRLAMCPFQFSQAWVSFTLPPSPRQGDSEWMCALPAHTCTGPSMPWNSWVYFSGERTTVPGLTVSQDSPVLFPSHAYVRGDMKQPFKECVNSSPYSSL